VEIEIGWVIMLEWQKSVGFFPSGVDGLGDEVADLGFQAVEHPVCLTVIAEPDLPAAVDFFPNAGRGARAYAAMEFRTKVMNMAHNYS
jgi:hypothetical protein